MRGLPLPQLTDHGRGGFEAAVHADATRVVAQDVHHGLTWTSEFQPTTGGFNQQITKKHRT